jgi:hypothetical protein
MNFLINKVCELIYDNVVYYLYKPSEPVAKPKKEEFIIVTPTENKSIIPLKTIEHLNEIKNFEFKKNLHYYYSNI